MNTPIHITTTLFTHLRLCGFSFLLLSQTMYDFPVLEYGHCENSIILFINYNWIITNFNLQMLFPKSNIEIQASRLFYIASV